MAIIRLRSTDGNDADNGSTWALAKATLVGAFAAASPGDTIWVSQSHAETQGTNMALASPGTAALPVRVICVNDGADPATALATTATVTTTSSTSITFTGFAYYYGITFTGATSGTGNPIFIGGGTNPSGTVMRSCTIGPGSGNTGNSGVLIQTQASNADDQICILRDCMINLTHANHRVTVSGGYVDITGGSVTGTVPTVLFYSGTTSASARVRINGMDLSLLGSGNSILSVAQGASVEWQIRGCKLGASVVLTTGAVAGPGGNKAEFYNCDSTSTNYRYWYTDYAGTIEHEITIVRTGGATDGTTPISRELISSANANYLYPLTLEEIVFWNETTGSAINLAVHTVTDNVTLTDQEIYLEVDYLGTSGFPLSVRSNDADNLTDRLLSGSASNQTASTETWTTTGLTTPVKQQLQVSVTPTLKGPVRCRVVLVKPSTTVYVCPKVEVS